MNTDRSPRPIVDIPLPGHYEILTVQVNATLSVRTGLAKWVMTMRDPSPTRQIELWRQAGQCPWPALQGTLTDHVSTLVESMNYLGAMPNA